MRRLYYLVEDVEKVDWLADQLQQMGVFEWRCRHFEKGTSSFAHSKCRLSSRFLSQQLDIVHSGERGIIFGFFAGLLCFLIGASTLMAFNYGAYVMRVEVFFPLLMLSTLIGSFLGCVVGLTKNNWKVSRMNRGFQQGQCLMMIDLPSHQVPIVHRFMKEQHSVIPRGEDSTSLLPASLLGLSSR